MQLERLRALTYVDGFTLWRYITAHAHADLAGEGYFDDAAHQLETGDVLFVTVNDGASPGDTGVMAIVESAGGHVVAGDFVSISDAARR